MNMEDVKEPAHDPLRELQARYGPQLDQARENLSELNHQVTTFIRQNPGTCLLGALALGYVIGRIAQR
jgi:hypothetical protein